MTCTMAVAVIQVNNTAETDEIDYYKKNNMFTFCISGRQISAMNLWRREPVAIFPYSISHIKEQIHYGFNLGFAVIFGDVGIICWNTVNATYQHSYPMKEERGDSQCVTSEQRNTVRQIFLDAFPLNQHVGHVVCCSACLLLYSYGYRGLKRQTRKNGRKSVKHLESHLCME